MSSNPTVGSYFAKCVIFPLILKCRWKITGHLLAPTRFSQNSNVISAHFKAKQQGWSEVILKGNIQQSPNPLQNWTRNISPKSALKRKKDHCILITKYSTHMHFFFKLLRIFFRNPLKNKTLDISQNPARKKLTIPQSPNPPQNWTRNISPEPAPKRKDHCILMAKYASHIQEN